MFLSPKIQHNFALSSGSRTLSPFSQHEVRNSVGTRGLTELYPSFSLEESPLGVVLVFLVVGKQTDMQSKDFESSWMI